MHYILDGYNIIKSRDDLTVGALYQQREKLLQLIESQKLHGSSRNLVTVVFDGRPHISSPRWTGSSKVIFSEYEDADEIIKRLITEHKQKKILMVVSNDKRLQHWAKIHKAQVMSVEEFLKPLSEPKHIMRPPKKVDRSSEEEINNEFKSIWKIK